MLRRLDKRILIDLPDAAARQSIFQMNLPSLSYDDNGYLLVDTLDYEYLSSRTEGKGIPLSLIFNPST
ncbi:hypothetical protein HDU67_006154 [Dinochytrium kinnereticum]|nr:hypothetical protein HDU67_006154 [Dinochytrium kinnereticum]